MDKWLFLSLILILITGCEYSPWQINRLQCDGFSIPEQLDAVAEVEQMMLGSDSFKVGFVADSQLHPQSLYDAIGHLNQQDDLAFLFVLGDLSEMGLEKEVNWACQAFKRAKFPVLVVIGNHDSISFGKKIWEEAFKLFNYSFSFLNTRFIVYNDNKYEFSDVPDHDFISQAANLSTDELRNHTIAVSHIQPWSIDDDQHEVRDFKQFLYDRGIGYTIHGHTSKFSYFQDNVLDLTHYIVGDAAGGDFAIMNVMPNSINFKSCSPECLPAVLE